MNTHTLRIRVKRAKSTTISIDAQSMSTPVTGAPEPVVFGAKTPNTPIKEALEWVLKSPGWVSSAAATQAGVLYTAALTRTLAYLRIGADFGGRAPKHFIFDAGLQLLENQSGRRTLRDIHGTMVYESDPTPQFAALGDASFVVGASGERFSSALEWALRNPEPLAPEEQLSAELFGASFFQESTDSRFLLAMMAVEALLKPALRTGAALEHVDMLISATDSSSLQSDEKASLLGSLSWLRHDSISRSGRRLAEERLSSREYGGVRAAKFFALCYDLRSHLVHGHQPPPSREKVSEVAAPLGQFVGDLLAGKLLHALPRP